MGTLRLGLIVPTISGREESLQRTLDAYEETLAGVDYELITPKDHANWPTACNQGVRDLEGFDLDAYHFGADDLVPLEGWFWPAAIRLEYQEIAAARVWDFTVPDRRWAPTQEIDGRVGEPTRFTRVPTLSVEMVEAIGEWPEIIYYADVWVSVKAKHLGWPTRVTGGYDFVHYWHQTGRLQDEGEKAHAEFLELVAGIDQ